jgi:hypothetical protein
MPTGWDALQHDREERPRGTLTPYLTLKEKDNAKLARIRFISDISTFEWGWFHPVLTNSRTGKKYEKLIYCMAQDGDECKLCQNEETARVKKKLFFWVWTYGIYHTRPDDKNEWKKVDYYGDILYYEEINQPRLLQTGPGQSSQTEDKFGEWAKRYKTLCDREYDWARKGTGLDTRYDLTPREDSKKTEEAFIVEAREKLAPLSTFIDKMKPTAEGADPGTVDDDIESVFN